MSVDDRPITLQEAADELGVHYMTVYRYVRTGRLDATKVGTQWRVDPDALRAVSSGDDEVSDVDGAQPRLLARLVAGDEAGAWAIVEAGLASGAHPAQIHLDLFVPTLDEIGEQWARGDITVADEHKASAVASRLVARMGPLFARRGIKRGVVVLGSVAGDLHALPTALLADLCRGRGLEAVDLGANSPAESFVQVSREAERLVGIGLCSTTSGFDDVAIDICRAVRSAGIDAPIVVGGGAIESEDHAMRLGADYWARDGGRATDLFCRFANQPPARQST